MTLLRVSNVSKAGLGNFKLDEISFTQRKNQKIAIAGETGSGKSTLLKIIAGLEQPDQGDVLLHDQHVMGPDETLVPGHPAIAYLSQDFHLPKSLHVEQILTYANKLSEESAKALFEVCEISHLMERKTNELSGGEKQRIALAKLLIGSPQLLLLDEPFSNLDMIHKNTLKKVLRSICEELKITCILVSHDPLDTLSWADKIIVMRAGKIVQKGSPRKVYSKPVSEYVAGLFGTYNMLANKKAREIYAVWNLIPRKQNSIIRPENIKLTSKKGKAISARVKKIRFFGSYTEIDVMVNEVHLIVKVKRSVPRTGDEVLLTCDPEDVTFIH